MREAVVVVGAGHLVHVGRGQGGSSSSSRGLAWVMPSLALLPQLLHQPHQQAPLQGDEARNSRRRVWQDLGGPHPGQQGGGPRGWAVAGEEGQEAGAGRRVVLVQEEEDDDWLQAWVLDLWRQA